LPDSQLNSDLYLRGIEMFNRQDFFEAHEVLEDLWRPSSGPRKKLLQGLIQTAVAFHHWSKGNSRGARSLLSRGIANLEGHSANFGGIRLDLLLDSLRLWQQAMRHDHPAPNFPEIVFFQEATKAEKVPARIPPSLP